MLYVTDKRGDPAQDGSSALPRRQEEHGEGGSRRRLPADTAASPPAPGLHLQPSPVFGLLRGTGVGGRGRILFFWYISINVTVFCVYACEGVCLLQTTLY